MIIMNMDEKKYSIASDASLYFDTLKHHIEYLHISSYIYSYIHQ